MSPEASCELRRAGMAYPRTCSVCGMGPCKHGGPRPGGGVTYCSECDNVTPRTRSLDGWRWRCRAFPRPDLPHFLGKGINGREVHERCMEINSIGACPKWEPLRGKIEHV